MQSSSIEALNKKCCFFWRLDKIFRTWPNNRSVITVDSLQDNNPCLSPTLNNLSIDPELFVNLIEWPDSDREDNDGHKNDELSSPNPSVATPSNGSRKRKEPASTSHQQGRGDNNIDIHHMFELNQSQWAAQEEKQIKIEASSKQEFYMLQMQQEKE